MKWARVSSLLPLTPQVLIFSLPIDNSPNSFNMKSESSFWPTWNRDFFPLVCLNLRLLVFSDTWRFHSMSGPDLCSISNTRVPMGFRLYWMCFVHQSSFLVSWMHCWIWRELWPPVGYWYSAPATEAQPGQCFSTAPLNLSALSMLPEDEVVSSFLFSSLLLIDFQFILHYGLVC